MPKTASSGRALALAALAVSIQTLPQPAQARGGGGVHPVIIVNSGRATPWVPLGPPAELPLDLLDTPPEAMSGALVPGVVVGQHRVRAADAVVLTGEVKQDRIEIAAGTVLVKVIDLAKRLPSDPPFPPLWCSTRTLGAFQYRVDCLQDSTGKGEFDRFIQAEPGMGKASFGVVTILYGTVNIQPVAYRPAKPDERPVTKVGYRLCAGEGDGRTIPYRFAPVLMQGDGDWRGSLRACPFGEWPDPSDKALVQVDRIKLRIEGSGDTARYTVVGRIAPGPIAGLGDNRPIRAAGGPPPAELARAEARAARPLVATGLPEGLTAGSRKHGEVIAQVPVVHGVTGVLKSDVTRRGLFSQRFSAGQYVYGVPMKSSDGQEKVTWCAPRPAEGDPGRYATICFPESLTGYVWAPSSEPLLSLRLSWPASYPADVVGLAVERKAASLGAPMKLTYVFDQWRTLPFPMPPVVVASVGVEMRVNGQMSPIDHVYVLPDKDGVFRLPLLNGQIRLAPVGKAGAPPPPTPALRTDRKAAAAFLDAVDRDAASVEVVGPTKADGALPLTGLVLVQAGPPGGGTRVPVETGAKLEPSIDRKPLGSASAGSPGGA